MTIIIYLLIIISGISYGICEFLRAISVEYLDPSLFTILSFLLSTIIALIFYLFYDNNLIKNLTKINIKHILIVIFAAITQFGFLYFFLSGMNLNNKLPQPINVGILSSIVALYFIITIISDIIYRSIRKQSISISNYQIIGCILIIGGIITISLKSDHKK